MKKREQKVDPIINESNDPNQSINPHVSMLPVHGRGGGEPMDRVSTNMKPSKGGTVILGSLAGV